MASDVTRFTCLNAVQIAPVQHKYAVLNKTILMHVSELVRQYDCGATTIYNMF